MVMQLYPPASTGNVVGPASAVNGNLAAFDGTTGELLEDSGIATSQVATSQTAATAVARLALTGLARGARVYQTDTGFWYELTNAAAPSDAASWQAQPKVYQALLNQTGTDAPVATVQRNDLGIAQGDYGYASQEYTLTKTGAFPVGKTALWVNSSQSSDGYDNDCSVAFTQNDANTLRIAALVTGTAQNNELVNTSIRIEVYPA